MPPLKRPQRQRDQRRARPEEKRKGHRTVGDTVVLVCKQCGCAFYYTGRSKKPPQVCSTPDCVERRKRAYSATYRRRHGSANLSRIKKNCVVCGKQFSLTDNKGTQTCGKKCGGILSGLSRRLFRTPAEQLAQRRGRWRQQNHLRNSRTAGAEKFEAVEIFERDGWCCGLCGGKVNKRLRYPHPRSATLDHIVPLSKGGGHSRANTHCAHFVCNVKKQAGPGGQLRLFG